MAALVLDALCGLTGHFQWAPWGEWWYEHVCRLWGDLVPD